jgi:ribosomal-protein-alanine N-acetyltransferase
MAVSPRTVNAPEPNGPRVVVAHETQPHLAGQKTDNDYDQDYDLPPMPTREYQPADLDRIAEIEQATFERTAFSRRTFRRFERDSRSIFLVCEENDEVTGYVVGNLCRGSGSLYVASIAVHSDHRRRGIATNLMHALTAQARREDAHLIWLHVRVSNQPAIDFYRHLDFHITHRVPRYYKEEDAYIMMRPIPPS